MKTRTPPSVSASLLRLAVEVVPGGTPLYVPVEPQPGGTVSECFANVAAVASERGGEIAFGWALWEWPNIMVEAEFHAVWRSPRGDLIDVSPRTDTETRILFLPDPRRVFVGQQVNNVRRALHNDLRVHELISVSDRIFDVLNAGERAHQLGQVVVPKNEILPLLMRKEMLVQQLQRILPGRNAPCPCGSGRKYKKCCGPQAA